MTPDQVARVVAGLTEAQREALGQLTGEWLGGPDLPISVIDHLADLRLLGLVERHFHDMHPPQQSHSRRGLSVRLGACWHFRQSPAVAAALANPSEVLTKGGEK